MLSKAYWEDVFVEADPWGYADSEYEAWKFELTLSVLRQARPKRALEIGCAEGHFTSRLAPLVGSLTAVDISAIALSRAAERCRELENVKFATLDLLNDPLPGRPDLIVCSEVLFYFARDALFGVAKKIASRLEKGGLVLLAHGNQVSDDPTRTGFDWGHPFGAKTIGEVFAAIDGLHLLRQIRTPLFTIQLFRKAAAGASATAKAELIELELPADLKLDLAVEKTIIWDGTALTRDAARQREVASTVPILMYHSIAQDGPAELRPYRVTPKAFREQLRWLRRNGFHSVTLVEWAECMQKKQSLRGRPIIITFDDGYEDFFVNAWPELERADFSATVFAVTDNVGGVADWDRHVSTPLKLMGWRELQTLEAAGITIGSHTASHKDLTAISLSEARREGERALRSLKRELGREVECVAFPWGRANREVRRTLSECGYRVAVTTYGGRATLNDDPMNLPRIEILADDEIEAFGRKVAPGGEAQAQAPGLAPILSRAAALIDIGGQAVEPGIEMPIRPDYARALSARIDAIVGEFVRLQNQLLNELKAPASLQSRMAGVFALPVTGRVTRPIRSGHEIGAGVKLFFDAADEVTLIIDAKRDHAISPPDYLNTLRFNFAGSSGWAWFEFELEWGELSAAERFQASIYCQPSRTLNLQMKLRLTRRDGHFHELSLTNFELSPDDRNAIGSGEIAIPDFIAFDIGTRPKLLVLLDIGSDLSLLIHYFNVYFA